MGNAPTDPAIMLALAQIRDAIERQTAMLQAFVGAAEPMPEPDDSAVAGLLEATARAFAGTAFAVSDLINTAQHTDADLLAALTATVGDLRPSSGKTVGRLLLSASRAASPTGPSVTRIGEERGRCVWSVALRKPTDKPTVAARTRRIAADCESSTSVVVRSKP